MCIYGIENNVPYISTHVGIESTEKWKCLLIKQKMGKKAMTFSQASAQYLAIGGSGGPLSSSASWGTT